MVKFYCDERFGGWEGCVPRAVVDACAEESLKRKERFVVRIWFNYHI